MPVLPVLSGKQVVRVFERLGWEMARQHGSHIILAKEGHVATLSVPDHKEVAKGIFESLIRSAGLRAEEYVETLKKPMMVRQIAGTELPLLFSLSTSRRTSDRRGGHLSTSIEALSNTPIRRLSGRIRSTPPPAFDHVPRWLGAWEAGGTIGHGGKGSRR